MSVFADTIVKARVSREDKEEALRVLEKFGLSMSDLIRLTIRRVADEGGLPFDLRPRKSPIFLENLSPEQIEEYLREGLDDIRTGRTESFEEFAKRFKEENRL